jgi:hypothetical protein
VSDLVKRLRDAADYGTIRASDTNDLLREAANVISEERNRTGRVIGDPAAPTVAAGEKLVTQHELWAMEAQARAQQCEDLLAEAQAERDALRTYAEGLLGRIQQHNRDLAEQCAARKCHFKEYDLRCPECPKDYELEMTDADLAPPSNVIPTGVPEPKVDHVFPLYPDTRQEAHEIGDEKCPVCGEGPVTRFCKCRACESVFAGPEEIDANAAASRKWKETHQRNSKSEGAE